MPQFETTDRQDAARREFAQDEIIATFEKLGLNNPATRRWLTGLAESDGTREPQYWILSDSGTSNFDVAAD
jgi:hypothetical protein